MDFLEIRRKAKERAEARDRGGASARSEPAQADPQGEPTAAPAEDIVAGLRRLEPLEAVVQAVAAAGGELTPIPDLPPWGEALGGTPEQAARGDAAAPAWTAPAPLWSAQQGAAPATVAGPLDPLEEFFYREDEAAPGLPDLDFAAAASPQPAEVADARIEYLTFFLGFEEYAIEIERVREVLKAPVVTEVPRAPRHVLGVIMVRGDVIAVFDPRRRLGLPEVDRTASPRVLVCDDGLGPIGLLVDAVAQVVRLRRSDIEPRPQGIGGVSAEYISGIGRDSGRMFIVLDLPVVLRGKKADAAEARA